MEQNQQTTAQQVINKLDKDCVKPIARWRFVMRNNSFWALWGLSVVIGSCAVAATIFVFINSGWQYHNITHDTLLRFLLDVLPLFWIVSFALMILFGYYNVRHTNRGYRFSFFLVVILSVIASFIGGTILYTLGVAGDIDDLRKPIPFSNPILSIEEQRWNDNSRGLISGFVQSFDKDKELLTIQTFDGNSRVLSTSELDKLNSSLLVVGSQIRVIGSLDVDNPDNFIACVILPWVVQGVPGIPSPMIPIISRIDERKVDDKRINKCKDVRPYQMYKQIFITN